MTSLGALHRFLERRAGYCCQIVYCVGYSSNRSEWVPVRDTTWTSLSVISGYSFNAVNIVDAES